MIGPKKLLFSLLILQSVLFAHEHDTCELIDLPHPIKRILSDSKKYDISEDQKKLITQKVVQNFPPRLHQKLNEAKELEEKLKKEILTDSSKDSSYYKEKLDDLARLKKEVTEIHIDALFELRKIVNKEQFEAIAKDMGYL